MTPELTDQVEAALDANEHIVRWKRTDSVKPQYRVEVRPHSGSALATTTGSSVISTTSTHWEFIDHDPDTNRSRALVTVHPRSKAWPLIPNHTRAPCPWCLRTHSLRWRALPALRDQENDCRQYCDLCSTHWYGNGYFSESQFCAYMEWVEEEED